jgi:hypothetical protein
MPKNQGFSVVCETYLLQVDNIYGKYYHKSKKHFYKAALP